MTNFWIVFGISGLIWIPCILFFTLCVKDVKNKIIGSIVSLCLWFFMAGGVYFQNIGNQEKWNNGYCECGAHWEFKAVTKGRSGCKTKYYACPECYTEITLNY